MAPPPDTTENDVVVDELNQNTVFIDTSLDTHLVTIVSDSDTVSDLKKKIMLEHRQCFPTIGDIKIHCLKVKRKGIFYHLVDSMLVKSAFSTIKKNWFVSVEASHVDQATDSQPLEKRKARDQLALPWITDSRSTDKHDNYGSPSVHPKIVSFENQKAPSVDQLTSGDSCKDVSKNIDQDRSSHDKLDSIVLEKMHTENNDLKSKKRTRDVHSESLLEGASGSGLSVKKKRKTQKGEGNVKASEENKVSTFDTDKGINNEDAVEHKSQAKDLSDESTRINEGENCNALDQLAVFVLSQDVGEETNPRKDVELSETVPDVAMAAEQNIQQEMPLEISQEKDDELVQKTVTGNELPSSLMRTSDCERDAPGITSMGKPKGSKRPTKHKAAEKESSSTSYAKKLNNIIKDVMDSVQQDVGSTVQESVGGQIDKEKQVTEVKLPERRKRAKKTAAKKKDESVVKHADNLVGDIALTVSAPAFDEKVNDEENEVSVKTVIDDSKKGDEMIVEEVAIAEPTESLKSQLHVENVEENSRTILKDTVRGRKKKKDVGKSTSRNDESVVKHTSDTATVANEEIVLPQSERKESLEITSTDAEISRMENNISQVIAEVIANSEKQNETVKSRKKKKSASRNDESVIKHTHDTATVTNEENVLPQSEKKETLEVISTDADISRNEKSISQVIAEGINGKSEKQNDTVDGTKKSKKKKKTEKSAARNENKSISKHADSDTCENVKEGESGLLPDVDKKDGDKPKEKDAQIFDERVVEKAKKNQKSSVIVTPPQDLPSGRQPADLELESEKSQNVDLDNLPNEASKNVTVSEVSKVNNESDIPTDESHKIVFKDYITTGRLPEKNASIDPTDESHKIVFKDYFTPGRLPEKNASIDGGKDGKLSAKEKNPKKKTFKPPHLKTTIQSSENENRTSKVPTDVVRDSNKNVDQFKTPKRAKKIDALKTAKSVLESSSSSSMKSFGRSVLNQKSNKQESVIGQTRVDTTKKSVPIVKSLLNTSGTIFGNDNDESSADDNAPVNSDSSTRTPSRTSSSSGDSDSSLDSRRNGSLAVKRKGGGANSSMNSQSKKMSMADLLRSSSRFKKAKLTASQGEDTESQQVDFVPESQLIT